MVWRTMSEWNERGRFISKGETCKLKDPSGNCLWEKSQTSKSKVVGKHWKECTGRGEYDSFREYPDWDHRDSEILEHYY